MAINVAKNLQVGIHYVRHWEHSCYEWKGRCPPVYIYISSGSGILLVEMTDKLFASEDLIDKSIW